MNVFASKRGIALESAIVFMMTTFALCSVILTFSLMIKSRDAKDVEKFDDSAVLDNIGERFVSAVRSGDARNFTADGDYQQSGISVSDEGEYTLELKDGDGKTVLTVSAKPLPDGGVEILRWNKYF